MALEKLISTKYEPFEEAEFAGKFPLFFNELFDDLNLRSIRHFWNDSVRHYITIEYDLLQQRETDGPLKERIFAPVVVTGARIFAYHYNNFVEQEFRAGPPDDSGDVIKFLLTPEVIPNSRLNEKQFKRIHWTPFRITPIEAIAFNEPEFKCFIGVCRNSKVHWKKFMVMVIVSGGASRVFMNLSRFYAKATIRPIWDGAHENEYLDMLFD